MPQARNPDKPYSTQERRSLHMNIERWRALEDIAIELDCIPPIATKLGRKGEWVKVYSWRTLFSKIARGELVVIDPLCFDLAKIAAKGIKLLQTTGNHRADRSRSGLLRSRSKKINLKNKWKKTTGTSIPAKKSNPGTSGIPPALKTAGLPSQRPSSEPVPRAEASGDSSPLQP